MYSERGGDEFELNSRILMKLILDNMCLMKHGII